MELRSVTCFTVQVAVWVPFDGTADQASVFPRLKTSSSGLWLKSSDAGVLCIDVRQEGAPLLSVKLKNQQQVLACTITWEALHCTTLCPEHSGGTRCWVLFLCVRTASKECSVAVKFEADRSGRECAACIQGLLDGSLARVQTAGPRQQLASTRGAPADLKEQIKAYLCDPQFMAYVDEVEQTWIELEQELGAV